MKDDLAAIDARLDRLIEAALSLDELTLLHVVEAWKAEDEFDRLDAWQRVKRAFKESGRERLMDETRDRMRMWVGDVKFRSGWLNDPGKYLQNDRARLRAEVARAILDAAAVIILGDLLDQTDRTLLAAPFGARLSKASRQ